MCRFIGLSVLLASVCVVQAHASEKDELALVMRQLDQVQAGLDRARWLPIRMVRMRAFILTTAVFPETYPPCGRVLSSTLNPLVLNLRYRFLSVGNTARREGNECCTEGRLERSIG